MLEALGVGTALVHLYPKRPGVVVPTKFSNQDVLALKFSYDYKIKDLVVGHESLSGTLSFGGRPVYCDIPWKSVFRIDIVGSEVGMVWGEDGKGMRLGEEDTHSIADSGGQSYVVINGVLHSDGESAMKPTSMTRTRPSWFRGVIDGGLGKNEVQPEGNKTNEE